MMGAVYSPGSRGIRIGPGNAATMYFPRRMYGMGAGLHAQLYGFAACFSVNVISLRCGRLVWIAVFAHLGFSALVCFTVS